MSWLHDRRRSIAVLKLGEEGPRVRGAGECWRERGAVMARLARWLVVAAMIVSVATPTEAQVSTQMLTQAPPAPVKPEEKAAAKPEEKPKTLWEEIQLFAYVENSYVWNLGHTGRDDVNELRLYDFDAGYSFNMAEFSIK